MARKTSAGPFRDSAGKRLDEYPHPSVAVDVALLTVLPGTRSTRDAGGTDDALAVLLVPGKDPVDGKQRLSLPGGFVHEGERLSSTVRRVLEEKYGIVGLEPRQLGVFDDPDRDPRGWVMSVAHAATVPFRKLGPRSDLHLAPVKPGWPVRLTLPKGQSTLPFDHDEIVERAIKDIRDRYAEHPDPDRLLGDTFTMRQLQDVHHAVSGEEIHKDTFRRLMSQSLEPVEGEFRRGGYGPPAQVYQREGESPSPSVQPDLWGRVAYTDEELLASVAAYLAVGGKPTAEGYRLWARENPDRPSEAWVRRRLSDKLGGWSGIVAASRSAR